MMIDWYSSEDVILINPRMPEECQGRLMKALEMYSEISHEGVWVTSSGSSGKLKLVLLKKSAILASAEAVNEHLHSDQKDRWFNALPIFHVGGIGIIARAFMSGARVISYQPQNQTWDARLFIKQMYVANATLCALVPAQIFDLVSLNIAPPKTLRAVIVGGGALSRELYQQAINKQWPLLPSYGLTECASQVATASLGSWKEENASLMPLNHVKIALDSDGYLLIKSPALLSGYIEINANENFHFIDPKNEGWFRTEDLVTLSDGKINAISRDNFFIKIGGESTDLQRLEHILIDVLLEVKKTWDLALIAYPDERLGHVIHLVIAGKFIVSEVDSLLQRFAQRVHPFEKIRTVHYLDKIPRSPLKKLLRQELIDQIRCLA